MQKGQFCNRGHCRLWVCSLGKLEKTDASVSLWEQENTSGWMEDIEARCAYGFMGASRVYFLQLSPSSSIVKNSGNDLLFRFYSLFLGPLIYLIIRKAGAEQTGPSWFLNPLSGWVQKQKLWTLIPEEMFSYLFLGSNIRRRSTLSVLIILCCGLLVFLIVFTKGGGIPHLPTRLTSSV